MHMGRTGKTAYATVQFSYDEERDVVRMVMPGRNPTFGVVAIHREPTKVNGHRQLFRRFKAILVKGAVDQGA